MKQKPLTNDLTLKNNIPSELSINVNDFRQFLSTLVCPKDYRENVEIIVKISHYYPSIIESNLELILQTFPTSYTMYLFEALFKDNPDIINDNVLFEYVYTLANFGLINDISRFFECLLKANRKDLLIDEKNMKVIFKDPKTAILHILEKNEEDELLAIYSQNIIKNIFPENALNITREFFLANLQNEKSKLFENNIMNLLEVATLKDRKDIIFLALAHNKIESGEASLITSLIRLEISPLLR